MKWIWTLAVALVMGCASAQELGFGQLPLLSGDTSSGPPLDSLLPSGMANDWDESTTSPGAVTNWVDKIQSFHWVKGSLSAPTNLGAGGVSFTLTNQLISTNIAPWLSTVALPGHDACLVVFKAAGNNTNNYSDITLLLGSGRAGGQQLLGFNNTDVRYYFPFSGQVSLPPLNVRVDMLYAGYFGGSENTYTNGVLMITGGGAGGGWGTGSGGAGTTVSAVGYGGYNLGTGNHAQFYGVLYRFIYWTNVIGFNSVQVSNIHYWAKTKYGITP